MKLINYEQKQMKNKTKSVQKYTLKKLAKFIELNKTTSLVLKIV